eukprot:1865420-Alexandrium_andersonii.AAC.1
MHTSPASRGTHRQRVEPHIVREVAFARRIACDVRLVFLEAQASPSPTTTEMRRSGPATRCTRAPCSVCRSTTRRPTLPTFAETQRQTPEP